MRQRMIGAGIVCLAAWLSSSPTRAGADVIDSVTYESGFGFAQTDFGPGANVGGNDPVTFDKFNPGAGGIPADAQLQSVTISFNWGFQSQLSGTFSQNSDPASTITLNASGGITIGRPDVTITGPGDSDSNLLFPTQTFQNAASFTSATPGSFATTPVSTYFHALPPGYVVPPQDLPLNLKDAGGPLSTTLTAASPDFAKFLGPGTVTFDVVATAGLSVPNTSGNATGNSLPSPSPDVTLPYPYGISPPDPPPLVVLGLGFSGFLLARRFRSRSRPRADDDREKP